MCKTGEFIGKVDIKTEKLIEAFPHPKPPMGVSGPRLGGPMMEEPRVPQEMTEEMQPEEEWKEEEEFIEWFKGAIVRFLRLML